MSSRVRKTRAPAGGLPRLSPDAERELLAAIAWAASEDLFRALGGAPDHGQDDEKEPAA